MKRLLITLIFTLVSHPSWGAIYFVDWVAGNDANNGTTSATSWKHCPGDDNATGNADINLAAGDIVVFKGGVDYAGTATEGGVGAGVVNMTASGGGEGTRITYISGDRYTPSWGVGRGVIDGNNTLKYGFIVNGRDYIDIEGFEIKDIGAPTSNAAGIYYANDNDYNRVRYCLIHDVNWIGPTWYHGVGIECNRATYNIFEYNTIYNCSEKCIEMVGGGGRLGGGTPQDGHNNTVRYNVCHNSNHIIVLNGDLDQAYGNILYQSGDSSVVPVSYGFLLKVDKGSGNKVYNNIGYNSRAGFAILVGDDNLIYNNTIYGIANGISGYYHDRLANLFSLSNGEGSQVDPLWSAPKLLRNQVINNNFYYLVGGSGDDAPKFIMLGDGGGAGVDNLLKNNIFFGYTNDTMGTASRVRLLQGVTYTYHSMTELETNFNAWLGNGTGNVASGNVVADPIFSGGTLGALTGLPTSLTGTCPTESGFWIPATSPAVGIGLTLGSPYDTDICGRPRINYDAGAYEYIPSNSSRVRVRRP